VIARWLVVCCWVPIAQTPHTHSRALPITVLLTVLHNACPT